MSGQANYRPCCPHCGNPLSRGGVAVACGPRLTSTTIPLADYCADADCRRARDEAAIAKAVAAGVIDP